MRRIYALAFILLLLLVGYGILTFHSGYNQSQVTIARLQAERDSIDRELHVALEHGIMMRKLAIHNKKLAHTSDSLILVKEKQRVAERKVYEVRIRKAQAYSAEQLDSAVVARYPDSLLHMQNVLALRYGRSINQNLRKVVLPEWRVRMMFVEVQKFDSVSSEVISMGKIIGQQKESIDFRDRVIKAQDGELQDDAKAIAVLMAKGENYEKEIDIRTEDAKKLKRQRNVAYGSAGALGALILYKGFQALLKR